MTQPSREAVLLGYAEIAGATMKLPPPMRWTRYAELWLTRGSPEAVEGYVAVLDPETVMRAMRVIAAARAYRSGGHDTCATGCQHRIELDASINSWDEGR